MSVSQLFISKNFRPTEKLQTQFSEYLSTLHELLNTVCVFYAIHIYLKVQVRCRAECPICKRRMDLSDCCLLTRFKWAIFDRSTIQAILCPFQCIMPRSIWSQPSFMILRKTHFKITLVRRATFCWKSRLETDFPLRNKMPRCVLYTAEPSSGMYEDAVCLCACMWCQGAKVNRHGPCSQRGWLLEGELQDI